MIARFLTIVCCLFISLKGFAYQVIEDKATLPLLTKDLADRKVLKIRLDNGLEAILISDPHTEQSGAMLSVNVGSWDEPKDTPGLAHYLEHMLFLGTKKYPDESGYQKYISENGGVANAFTSNSNTSYLFSIKNHAFEEALDRFANFFIDPLFNPSGIARELNAIDQEYAKNVENDDIRLLYVDKQLGNPEHPNHSFSMGNKKSLSNVSEEKMISFYKHHYSANLMRLIVYSNLPLDKLRELVVQDFSAIKNNNIKPFSTTEPIWDKSKAPHFVYIEPVKNQRTLTLIWELPTEFSEMKESQPSRIICFLLGHEAEQSLLAELKRRNLAEKLQCGSARIGAKNVLLYLDIDLTDQGVAKIDDIIGLIFDTINIFEQKHFSPELFEEHKQIATIQYQYQPRQYVFDALMQNAHSIWEEDLATYPEVSLITQKYNPDAVKALLHFLTPKNARFYITVPSSLVNLTYDLKEPWTGASYAIQPIDPKKLENWENPKGVDSITYPGLNPFVPKSLNIVPSASSQTEKPFPHPEAIVSDSRAEIYFAQDNLFKSPVIFWNFEIKTPCVDNGNPMKSVLADLYAKSIKEALKKYSYYASMAGLEYEIKRGEFGISITIKGYSDKASKLFDEILAMLKQVKVSETEFEIYKESLKREYQNFAKKSPLEQASEAVKNVIYKRYSTEHQKAFAINKVDLEKFNDFISVLYDQTYVEGLLYGNITKEEALQQSNKLFETLGGRPYPKEKQQKKEVIILPPADGPFYYEMMTEAQGNAVILTIQHPEVGLKAKTAQQIIMLAIEEPFYSSLRTKQQTGYIVYSSPEQIRKQLFDVFAVQSNSHDVRDLLARFELFIEGYLQEIRFELPEERFNIIKASLIDILEHPAKNVSEMGELLKKIAFEYDADFDWFEKRIEAMKTMSYSEFITLANSALGKSNKRRVAVLLKGTVPKDILMYEPITTISKLRRISTFSSGE